MLNARGKFSSIPFLIGSPSSPTIPSKAPSNPYSPSTTFVAPNIDSETASSSSTSLRTTTNTDNSRSRLTSKRKRKGKSKIGGPRIRRTRQGLSVRTRTAGRASGAGRKDACQKRAWCDMTMNVPRVPIGRVHGLRRTREIAIHSVRDPGPAARSPPSSSARAATVRPPATSLSRASHT